MHADTSNDEIIARALADQEEQVMLHNSRLGQQQQQPQQQSRAFDYPGDLRRRQTQEDQYSHPRQHAPILQGRSVSTPFPPAMSPLHQPSPSSISTQPPRPSLFGRRRRRVPMCNIPCVVGPNSVCVEMMIDTGAESSVISVTLAKQLGLMDKLDRSERGVAAGVGTARILGGIRDVLVVLGHVEFYMEFIVLQVPDRLLLLGLDQMRKYKCIVDLEKDILVFGGSGGVEVPMLPPEQQSVVGPPRNGGDCTIA
jgi:hypothetical protein